MKNRTRASVSAATVKPAQAIKADLAARIIASVDRMGLTVREAMPAPGRQQPTSRVCAVASSSGSPSSVYWKLPRRWASACHFP
jgi:hypothetical protein